MGESFVKIGDLPAITQISNDDVIIMNDTTTNTTCKCTVQQLLDFIIENLPETTSKEKNE